MTVVCNTSPISNLAAIGQLTLLQKVYGNVIIPQTVADEITKVATIYTQATSVFSQSWIGIQTVNNATRVLELRGRKLDAGESEAIALALEINAELLVIDERLGREIAVSEGLNITGLIGVLLEAKNRGLISQVKPMMDALIVQAGFRVSSGLYTEVLRLSREESVIG
jgi:hypothetical protein